MTDFNCRNIRITKQWFPHHNLIKRFRQFAMMAVADFDDCTICIVWSQFQRKAALQEKDRRIDPWQFLAFDVCWSLIFSTIQWKFGTVCAAEESILPETWPLFSTTTPSHHHHQNAQIAFRRHRGGVSRRQSRVCRTVGCCELVECGPTGSLPTEPFSIDCQSTMEWNESRMSCRFGGDYPCCC